VNRFWWATHVTHHNSEKYNLSVAFRLGWTQHIKIIFFIPVALMGFDPVLFLYVIKLRFSINFGFIPNILENYRPQLNIFVTHLIIEFIIQAMINIWIRTLDQHLSFGIECLALFNQRKRNQCTALTPLIHITHYFKFSHMERHYLRCDEK
jgi:hypothetical protein